jgi:hypothetical protein
MTCIMAAAVSAVPLPENLDIAGVYRQLGTGAGGRLWTFYMRTYEMLWKLDRGTLAVGPSDARLDQDAQLGARLIRWPRPL